MSGDTDSDIDQEGIIKELLKGILSIFVNIDTVEDELKQFFNDILNSFKEAFVYDEYLIVFEELEKSFNSPYEPVNPSFEYFGINFELKIFDLYMQYRDSLFVFLRGVFYPLFCFAFINFIYKTIRGSDLFNPTFHVTWVEYSPSSLGDGGRKSLGSGGQKALNGGPYKALPPSKK